MADLQVKKASGINIQAMVSNPYSASDIKLFENYQPQTQTNTEEIEEKQYQNLQKAETSYFLAAANLNKSNVVKQFNMLAKFNGYNNVNLLHRHDVA